MKKKNADNIFNIILFLSGIVVMLIILGIFISLFVGSIPAFKHNGFKFFITSVWNPVTDRYGVIPFVIGTLLTSFLALFISIPFSFGISILISEYLRLNFLSNFLISTIDLLAGIPSVIYGFWGLFFIVPLIRKIEVYLGKSPYGVSIIAASIVLAIMIIPYFASLAKEILSLVPDELKEASYSLGATKSETILKLIIPYSRSGLFAGIVLAFGRALGETMAVTMLVGNSSKIPVSIFSPGNTMASVIANEFAEATGKIYLSTLIEVAMVLFLISLIFNLLGKKIINKFRVI